MTTLRLKGAIITWIGCTSCELYVSMEHIYINTLIKNTSSRISSHRDSYLCNITNVITRCSNFWNWVIVLSYILETKRFVHRFYIRWKWWFVNPYVTPLQYRWRGVSKPTSWLRDQLLYITGNLLEKNQDIPSRPWRITVLGTLYFRDHENSSKESFLMFPRRYLERWTLV